jgi:superfamily II DNA or RNA helicase
MSLVISEPSIVRLDGLSDLAIENARDLLTYQDKGVEYLINNHKRKRYWKASDPEGWTAQYEALKAKRKACILFEDGKGFFTYSGLAPFLSEHLGGVPIENRVVYPEPVGMAWDNVPEHEARYYQDGMEVALIEAKHAAVEVGTGLGKSRVILDLCRKFGLQTIVMAPSRSIASQLLRDFQKHLGRRYVGMFGDGKKQFDKLITIGIGASLTKLRPGDPAYEKLSKAQVFIVDESHGCPADTLEVVCQGLARNAPYRFFFSATQVRNDGSELVLKGITGPVVYRMTVKEGVDQGFLAKPHFKVVKVPSTHSYDGDDVQKLTRVHLYLNPEVLRRAGDIANKAVKLLGHQVLILVDEMSQFPALLPYLHHEVRFAHGGVTKDNAAKLPKEFHDSDPQALVDAYNAGEFPILVGTSCISTGTDIKACQTVIFLMGGRSSIAVPQSVGRGTRKFMFADGRKKTAFNFVDFAVQISNRKFDDGNAEHMSPVWRHALARAEMYRDLYPSVQWL